MKYFRILMIMAVFFFIGCTDDDDTDTNEIGNWVKQSSFEGVGRSGAVVFVVGDKAYVGLGYDGDDYLNDFWSYNPDQNFWERIADFPGVARTSAVAFAVDNKGYVGIGYDGIDELTDFWKYDVSANIWTQIEDFAGPTRVRAVAFSANNKGYVGTGYDKNYLKDFWEYDPSTDEWKTIVSLEGEKREAAVVFNINEQIFVGTGNNNGILQDDFWEYDYLNTDWLRKEELDADDDYEIIRSNAVAFSIGEYGYITTGITSSNLSSTWRYDPLLDEWSERTLFEGSSREGAIAFSINDRAFVALGKNGSSRFDDIWEFMPLEDYDADD